MIKDDVFVHATIREATTVKKNSCEFLTKIETQFKAKYYSNRFVSVIFYFKNFSFDTALEEIEKIKTLSLDEILAKYHIESITIY